MSSTSWETTRATHPTAVLTRLARGVWLPGVPAEPDDEFLAVRRFAEALPPHSVVVGRSAGVIHRGWLPPQRNDHGIEFASAVPGRRGREMNRTRRPELQGSRRQFGPGDIVEVDGIAVTSPARTWLDLAGRLTLVQLVAFGDSLLRGATTVSALEQMVLRSGRRRGVVTARMALPLLDARSRSLPESHLRVELLLPGWPRFEVNQWVKDVNGGWLAEPDLSNEQYGVAIEYQGGWHSQDTRMRKDLTRGVEIVGNRWLTLPVGPAEVFTHQHRLRVAVAALLRRGGWPGPQVAPTPRPRRRVATSAPSGQQ